MTQAFNSKLDFLQQRLGNVIFRSDRLIYEFLLTFYTSQALASSSAKLSVMTTLQDFGLLFMSIHNTLSTMSASLYFGEVCDVFAIYTLAVIALLSALL